MVTGMDSPSLDQRPITIVQMSTKREGKKDDIETSVSDHGEEWQLAKIPTSPEYEKEEKLPVTVESMSHHDGCLSKRSWYQRWRRLWYGLPTAAKSTLVLSILQAILMVSYGAVAVGLRNNDEEAHIATVIIIISVFVVYAVFDAVIYENTLQLLSAIILSVLMMARVLWFISTRPSDSTLLPLKIIWGALIAGEALALVVAASFACRGFGWRMYSKLGVDYRRKDAGRLLRLGLLVNLFNTLVKLDLVFVVAVAALGVDVSIERRSKPDATLLVVSAIVFISGVFLVSIAFAVVRYESWASRLTLIDLFVPFVLSGPIALSVIYKLRDADIANAGTSIIIGSVVLIAADISLWLALHVVVKHREAIRVVAGRVTLRMLAGNDQQAFEPLGHPPVPSMQLSNPKCEDVATEESLMDISKEERSQQREPAVDPSSSGALSDPMLAPLLTGAWLGKPSRRNQHKIRFFQLSLDGSTLRWGWKNYVRLYYVQDLLINEDALTITMTFLLDEELRLKFPDAATLETWRRGLERQIIALLAPDGRVSDSEDGIHGGGPRHMETIDDQEQQRHLHEGMKQPPPLVARRRIFSQSFQRPSKGRTEEGTIDSAMEDGVLRLLGTSVKHFGRTLKGRSTVADSDQEQGSSNDVRPTVASSKPMHDSPGNLFWRSSSTTTTTANEKNNTPERGSRSRYEPHPSKTSSHITPGQLAKRARMAAWLQLPTSTHGPSRRSSSLRPYATSSSPEALDSVEVRRRRTIGDESLEPNDIHHHRRGSFRWRWSWFNEPERTDKDASILSSTNDILDRQSKNKILVSVGTQTDEDELAQTAPEGETVSSFVVEDRSGVLAAAQRSESNRGVQQLNARIKDDDGSENEMCSTEFASGIHAAREAQSTEFPTPSSVGTLDADIASQYAAMLSAGINGGTEMDDKDQRNVVIDKYGGFQGVDDGNDVESRKQSEGWNLPSSGEEMPVHGLACTPIDGRTDAKEDAVTYNRGKSVAHEGRKTSSSFSLASCTPSRLTVPSSPASPPTSMSPLSPSYMSPLIPVEVIEFEELSLGRLLGSGSEGAVHAAWYRETPVAVKSFVRMEDSAHEIRMYLAAGSHDNVVALRALCQHSGAMHLVLEYCPRGTLDAMLHHSAPSQWNPARVLPIIRSIARGMHHLHSRGIVHRDLKPANIFVCAGQIMKVGDLGMAQVNPHDVSPPTQSPQKVTDFTPGTIQYTAPELINSNLLPEDNIEWESVVQKIDVWSFGVTIWEVLERKRPFEGFSEVAVQSQWLSNPYQARLPPVKIPESTDIKSSKIIRGLADIVEACTRLDPPSRPSFRDVLHRLNALAKIRAAEN